MSGSTADPSVERVRETVAARLNAVGQRLTANRQSLLETLIAAPRPLTIPEILDDRPGLAQSSVYRNLVVPHLRVVRAGGGRPRVGGPRAFGRGRCGRDHTQHRLPHPAPPSRPRRGLRLL
jgi:hypothetical protein